MTHKNPIQLDSGEFACPDCNTPLRVSLVPYFEDGNFLGAFDGLMCPMCRYGLFSEKGYEELDKAVQNTGLTQKTALVTDNKEIIWKKYVDIQSASNSLEVFPKYIEKKVKGKSATDVEYLTPHLGL